MNIDVGGFSVSVISVVPGSYCCLICSNILNNPYQAPCGCRFCLDCISNYLKENDKNCPGQTEDCHEVELNMKMDMRPDFLAKREINKLMVICPFNSCNEECELRVLMEHLSVCAKIVVKCNVCGDSVTRDKYELHCVNECLDAVVSCEFCHVTKRRRELLAEHHNYENDQLCVLYEDYCPYNCGQTSKVLWFTHKRVCSNKYALCPYKSIGCTSSSCSVTDVTRHMTDSGLDHACILLEHFDNLNNELAHIKNTVTTVARDVEGKCSDQRVNDAVEEMREEMTAENGIVFGEFQAVQDSIVTMDNKLRNELATVAKVITDRGIEDGRLAEMREVVANVKTLMEGELEKLNSTVNAMNIRQKISTKMVARELNDKCSEERMNKLDNTVKSLTVKNSVMAEELLHLKTTVNLLSAKLKNVTVALHWRINNFSQTHQLNSPDFYSRSSGYRMGLRFEKRVKGYFSIIVYIKCGEFDDELSWPFGDKITLQIEDRYQLGRHYEICFSMDNDSVHVCNGQYGSEIYGVNYSHFVEYQHLKDKPYLLKDDSLCIRCLVDDE